MLLYLIFLAAQHYLLYHFWESNINAEIPHQVRCQLSLPHSSCLICCLLVLLQTSQVSDTDLHFISMYLAFSKQTKKNLNQIKARNTSQQYAQLAKKAESIVASIRNSVAANLWRYFLLARGTCGITSWMLCSLLGLTKRIWSFYLWRYK